MNRNNQPMFKLLFRPELYTLDEVLKMAGKNPDVLWVVYEAKRGTHRGERENVGTMSCATIVSKYG